MFIPKSFIQDAPEDILITVVEGKDFSSFENAIVETAENLEEMKQVFLYAAIRTKTSNRILTLDTPHGTNLALLKELEPVNDLRGQYLIARELQNLMYKYFRNFEPVMQHTVLVPSGLLNYDNIFGLFYTIIIPDEAEKFFTFRDIHRVGGFVDIAVLREHALSKESRIIRPSFRRVEKP